VVHIDATIVREQLQGKNNVDMDTSDDEGQDKLEGKGDDDRAAMLDYDTDDE
jgi:hypothetical protein